MVGNKIIVKELLRHGADPELKDVDGSTARRIAKKNGHEDIVALLERSFR